MSKSMIPDAEEQTRTLREKLRLQWETGHASFGGYLWHYTDARGLIGIVESGQLWMTNVYYLNDASELNYARTLIAVVLDEKQRATTDILVKNLLERVEIGLGASDLIFLPHVACFCEEGDLLSQWRAYADGGGGYALGFHPEDLTKDRSFLQLRQVIYDETKQRGLIETALDEFSALLVRVAPLYSGAKLDLAIRHISGTVSDFFREYSYCFKHPAFSEEREWRLVRRIAQRDVVPDFMSIKHLDFREAGGLVAPYVSQDVRVDTPNVSDTNSEMRLPLGAIKCGPMLDPVLAADSIRLLLRKLGYAETIEIDSSTAPLIKPYRAGRT